MHTLLRREASGAVLPPLSIAFARPEARYVEGLNAFRSDDLDGWLTVFATAVNLAAHATIGLAHEIGQLQRSWLELVPVPPPPPTAGPVQVAGPPGPPQAG